MDVEADSLHPAELAEVHVEDAPELARDMDGAASRKRRAASAGDGSGQKRAKCAHGKQRSKCKDCGGSAVCTHGKERYTCKDCGGSGICTHGRQRSQCKDCGGGGLCIHGMQRSK